MKITEVIDNKVILKIAVPKNNDKTPLAAEQMFASLHGIIGDNKKSIEHIGFEIVSSKTGILFFAITTKNYKDFVIGQIYAQYPHAEIDEVNDYTESFKYFKYFAISEISLKKNFILPIKTFANFDVDPLSALTNAMIKDNSDNLSSCQILLRPINGDWHNKAKKYINSKKGKGGDLGSNMTTSLLKLFTSEIVSSKNKTTQQTKPTLSSLEEGALSEIEKKITKVGYEVLIRIISLSNDSYEPKNTISHIQAAFNQYNYPHLNSFDVKKSKDKGPIIYKQFIDRYMGKKISTILNTEEVASLYHLPDLSVETPSIIYSKAKKAEPPINLPTEDVNYIGITSFRGISKRFGIKTEDRRRHMYILGKTGTGKSTMIKNMVIQDIINGKGVGIFDPHGDLVEDILNFIPPQRINDVVIIDPSDTEHPVSINLLELKDLTLKDLVADNIVSVFKKHFDSWGPRLEYLLHNCILTLIQVDNTSLLGIQRILVDKKYREKVLKQIDDPILLRFWNEEYTAMEKNPRLASEAIAPIQNKVGRFLSSQTMRNIVGQVTSTIDLEEIMNNNKILIVNLSQGKIGEEQASLFGGMLITRLQSAAMSRIKIIDEEKRNDFYLYVDEFQVFATNAFAKILSEARKFRLNLILAHQYIAQLDLDIKDAIFGNIGTTICFVVGPQDAGELEKEFMPVFSQEDLISLEKHHFYTKLMIDGMISTPFSAISEDLKYVKNDNKDKVIKVSRERYTRNKAEVEDKILRWAKN